jgi:UDP-glucose 4-epimerase
MSKTILVTGGSGYIGSHVCLELIEAGYNVVVIDSLENSTEESIRALETHLHTSIPFYLGKVQDLQLMRNIFSSHQISGVIHMAGYKSVKQSIQDPESYYDNNLLSTIALMQIMHEYECNSMIFSSSATVYGEANGACLESSDLNTLNPYGETKLLIERILDYAINYTSLPKSVAHRNSMIQFSKEVPKHEGRFSLPDIPISDYWSFISLRYFNPIGAHSSHIIGESPSGVPENLVPYIMKVLSGDLEKLTVFGNDYDTPDGTAIRDYIHVVDLAKAHVAALNYQMNNYAQLKGRHERFNIGTGQGYSVLDVINAFATLLEEEGNNRVLNWTYGSRRPGDAALIYANSEKARSVLGWEPELGIEEMCKDAWGWWKFKRDID